MTENNEVGGVLWGGGEREEPGAPDREEGPLGFCGMVGCAPPMQEVFRAVERLSKHEYPVLICGETGTGKELAARAIHALSPRGEGPFVAVNCASLRGDLTYSTLFGHEKGAFTGAQEARLGRIELAHGGTLFLDEIGEMHASAQADLLRVLEDHHVVRLGAEKPIPVDFRLMAATNAVLDVAVSRRRFRSDLFHRLDVNRIELPPLRERPGDVGALVDWFVRKHRTRIPTDVERFDPGAMSDLERVRWEGNVRQLENLVISILCASPARVVSASVLAPFLRNGGESRPRKTRLLEVLQKTDWRIGRAAAELGVHRNTLRRQMDRFGIEAPEDRRRLPRRRGP